VSKAFTKEDDNASSEALLELPQSPHPNYVTPAGKVALEERLSHAHSKLADLQTQKDDIDTHLPIAELQRDIRFLEERIKRAILIDPRAQPPGIVAFGAEVDVIDNSGKSQTYIIVGEDEADPARGLITPFSPLAHALIGAVIGDVVVWDRPKGSVELEITAIRFT
jgi:transcription elongation factor GreB